MSLEEIYQEVLLSHNEHPNNFEVLPDATHQAHGHNPLCGDEISIFVVINDGKIEKISFQGEGCAICKASASLMTEALKGLSVEEAQEKSQKDLSPSKVPRWLQGVWSKGLKRAKRRSILQSCLSLQEC